MSAVENRNQSRERARAAKDKEFWNKVAHKYDGVTDKLFGRPLPHVLELTAASVHACAAVLEVAAGTGLFTRAIASQVGHLVATDYADAMLEVLRQRVASERLANVEVARADIYALDYAPRSFDAVVASNVLHVVPDLPGALRALSRVLRPGGKLVTPTFCHDENVRSWFVSRALTLFGQPVHRRFTAESLGLALEQAGFSVVRMETVPGLIPITFVESILAREPEGTN
jgi:ubiquinone/menaquinone biosynthesis C-methylase UbiE